ncbi:helix-turn-helix domain-containing protein [Robiginitomaculum antarcticum]|uniref:helix-turn-helix domain-containing protein n=1 Tax=Robiginitomaculum antarcticum TaxID=437507 RepID=UPI0006870D0C|nr:helix-turn-helix transcriptional regulator [Robiginitomaculum antarcticum]
MQMNPDGAKIKRWREERCWSQEHLADAAGVSLRTVQRIENGDGASRDSVMALAAAYNVDVIALMVDPREQAAINLRQENSKTKDALRLGFLINLASYVFGMIVFAAISLGDGVEGYVMLVPAMWWTVGLAGFGLAAIIVELTTYYKNKSELSG